MAVWKAQKCDCYRRETGSAKIMPKTNLGLFVFMGRQISVNRNATELPVQANSVNRFDLPQFTQIVGFRQGINRRLQSRNPHPHKFRVGLVESWGMNAELRRTIISVSLPQQRQKILSRIPRSPRSFSE